MGLSRSSGAPKADPATENHNHLGNFRNKKKAWALHSGDSVLAGALELLSSESWPGATDTQ